MDCALVCVLDQAEIVTKTVLELWEVSIRRGSFQVKPYFP